MLTGKLLPDDAESTPRLVALGSRINMLCQPAGGLAPDERNVVDGRVFTSLFSDLRLAHSSRRTTSQSGTPFLVELEHLEFDRLAEGRAR